MSLKKCLYISFATLTLASISGNVNSVEASNHKATHSSAKHVKKHHAKKKLVIKKRHGKKTNVHAEKHASKKSSS